MNEKRELPMDLRIYVEDVTEHYNGKPAGMGKIFDAWLFDANLHVHLCSLTPTFEVWYIGSTYSPEREMTDEEREAADDYLREANAETPPVDYMGTRIEKVAHPYRVEPYPEVDEGEEEERDVMREVMEEHIEYLQGNTWDWEQHAS